MDIRETEEAVVIEPAAPATAAVIWLHGLGADGHDFVPIVPELRLPATLPVRFVFPHAPVRPVTINQGMAMRAWYDIYSLSGMRQQDDAGIRDSERIVLDLVRRERQAGIAADRLVIAGFSQGGAIALHLGLRYPETLAGILALSTYLPLADRAAAEANAQARRTPIFMCHGTHDQTLPIELGTASRDWLVQHGYTVEWRDYPMAHQVCAEQIADIAEWLQRRIDPASRIIVAR